jgi:hypothetical protein
MIGEGGARADEGFLSEEVSVVMEVRCSSSLSTVF